MKEFKSFFKTVGGNEGSKCHYPTRLDTYGCGCAHDCAYCYAKTLLDFRGLWKPNDVAVADPAKIRNKISSLPDDVQVVRLGEMTDCFQPIEKIHKVTYETIKALNEAGKEYLIVTKSDLVANDEYMAIMDKDLAHIQITVTFTDDETCAKYEKATPPSRRIRAIEKLYEAGFDVALRLSPFVPEFVDVDVINNVKCEKVIVEFLRVNSWIKKWFKIDYSKYGLFSMGYNHLSLYDKIALVRTLDGKKKQISVCEDEPEAYKFWRAYFNPNPDDCCNLRRNKESDQK